MQNTLVKRLEAQRMAKVTRLLHAHAPAHADVFATPRAFDSSQRPAYWLLGARYTIHTTAQQTGGAYSIIEEEFFPFDGQPVHVHHDQDEYVYILQGDFAVLRGTETFRVA